MEPSAAIVDDTTKARIYKMSTGVLVVDDASKTEESQLGSPR
jgi:hypothetical protein